MLINPRAEAPGQLMLRIKRDVYFFLASAPNELLSRVMKNP